METDIILRRVHELELEVQKLKAQVAKSPRRQVQVVVKKSVGFVLSYWTLLSFVVAIGVAIYIKMTFNVDYFENYRSLAATRKTAEFHNKLGNDLLLRQEWAAAEEAFTRALAANANDPGAGYGLLKSRIFKPAAGEKFTSPRTQDTMIAFLREQRPDDPDLDFLQAVRFWEQNQYAQAEKSLRAALERRPDFSIAQNMLGHMALSEGRVEAAGEWWEKAIASDPKNALAVSNLGFVRLLTGDLDVAATLLESAQNTDPSLVTALGLSDTLRLQGKFDTALAHTRNAVRLVVRQDIRESRYASGQWFYNHLPESEDDRTAVEQGVHASEIERKEGLCQFAYALDLALTGDPAAAEKPWAKARELLPDEPARGYMMNKIKATLKRAAPPAEAPGTVWLLEKYASLVPPAATNP